MYLTYLNVFNTIILLLCACLQLVNKYILMNMCIELLYFVPAAILVSFYISSSGGLVVCSSYIRFVSNLELELVMVKVVAKPGNRSSIVFAFFIFTIHCKHMFGGSLAAGLIQFLMQNMSEYTLCCRRCS